MKIDCPAGYTSRGYGGPADHAAMAAVLKVRDRGMTEAALGVDTGNPADAFAIYSRLGFQLTAYTAVMDKPVTL